MNFPVSLLVACFTNLNLGRHLRAGKRGHLHLAGYGAVTYNCAGHSEEATMSQMSEYQPGTFNWIDLMTTDAAAAKSFYGDLFGWSFEDIPVPDGSPYTIARLRDEEVAGLFQQGPDMAGIPPHWTSYVAVEDVGASTQKAAALGGAVIREPFDVMEAGRMAVIGDPSGAAFALWQAGQHCGAGLVNEPGALCWNELLTSNADAARDFYMQLFGWSAELDSDGPHDYTFFKNGDRPAAGMMPIAADMGDIPSHWNVYFAVEDCDATLAKADELGGSTIVPPTDIPEIGRFAVLSDSQNAAFSVIALENAD